MRSTLDRATSVMDELSLMGVLCGTQPVRRARTTISEAKPGLASDNGKANPQPMPVRSNRVTPTLYLTQVGRAMLWLHSGPCQSGVRRVVWGSPDGVPPETEVPLNFNN